MSTTAPDLLRGKARLPLQERLRPSWRRRLVYSPLTYMLLLSLLLHLSMVTIFRVVVYLPYTQVEYYSFKIVPETTVRQPAAPSEAPELPVRTPAGEGSLRISGLAGDAVGLPDIHLPTIEFAELERLRVAQEGLQSSSLYDRLYNRQPQDSWARFGRGMQRLGASIAEIASGEDRPRAPGAQEGPFRIRVRPSPGFVAEIVWSSGPPERQLLFSPPIPVLQQLEPSALSRPIELVLRVNAEGKVTSIWSPQGDYSELLDEVQDIVLRQYRFDPLPLEGRSVDAYSMGSMHIRAMGEEEEG